MLERVMMSYKNIFNLMEFALDAWYIAMKLMKFMNYIRRWTSNVIVEMGECLKHVN